MTHAASVVQSGARRWERTCVYLASTLFSIAFGLWIGKDVSWDQTNYHVYAGFTAFDTRLDQDFMPASIQSYLNRLSFVPFVKLAMTGIGSAYVAAALAALQSLAIWCCYEIGVALPQPTGRWGRRVPIVSAALAAMCPLYLVQIGTPANDVLTAIPVLAAWAVMLRVPGQASRGAMLFAAGLLLGIATGLKLTQGIFAVASLTLFLCIKPFRLRDLAIWIGAGCIGFLVVDGWWAYLLWEHFRNPVFPMFNGFFKSPDYFSQNIGTSARWLMPTWSDSLLLPFRMALPELNRYTELSAPDVRYAAALVALVLCVLATFARRLEPRHLRLLLGTAALVLLSWVLWQKTSGQGRYFAPIALAAGPLLVCWLWIASRSHRFLAYCLVAVIAVQVTGVLFGMTMGRADLKWDGPWLQIQMPSKLRDQPHLFLTGSTQTYSVIAPFLHPDGSIVNLGGQTVIQPGTPSAARLMALVDKFGDRIVYLERDPPEAVHGDIQLYKYGLELRGDCEPLGLRQYFEGTVERGEEHPAMSFKVCPVHRRAAPDEAYSAELREVRAATDAVMRACPANFSPDTGEIDGSNGRWRIMFPTRDTDLVVLDGQLMLSNFFHPFYAPIGTVENWSKGQGTLNCAHYPSSRNTDLSLFFTPEELGSMAGKEVTVKPASAASSVNK